MPFVLDASIAASWAFDDEDHPAAARALERLRTDQARAPSLWWYEMRNILVVNERRGRITRADAGLFLRSLSRLGVMIDPLPPEAGVMGLARAHKLSVYDVCYLELAQRDAIPLATLDARLALAAKAERVTLLDAE